MNGEADKLTTLLNRVENHSIPLAGKELEDEWFRRFREGAGYLSVARMNERCELILGFKLPKSVSFSKGIFDDKDMERSFSVSFNLNHASFEEFRSDIESNWNIDLEQFGKISNPGQVLGLNFTDQAIKVIGKYGPGGTIGSVRMTLDESNGNVWLKWLHQDYE